MRPREALRDMRSIATSVLRSVASPPLRQMSSNLQRLPLGPEPPEDDHLNSARQKRRLLKTRSRSPIRDAWRDDKVSEISTQVIPEPDGFPTFLSKLQHVDSFRKEIKIDLLEIVDTLNERDELCSVSDREFEARCTLEIFIAKYEEICGETKATSGEDLWRDQQICAIRTKCDEFGQNTTHVTLPKPFIIPAEELVVKRAHGHHNAPIQHFQFGLADQYIIKIWLEAPNSNSHWPPMELQSNLDPNGRMIKWLRDGTFSSRDIRLFCKGVMFPDAGAQGSFDVVLKLGGLRIQSRYRLRLDIQHSLPPHVRLQRGTSDVENIEASIALGISATVDSPELTLRTHHLSSSEAGDIDTDYIEAIETPTQTSPKLLPLIIPITKGRLCDAVIKRVLEPGEELPVTDNSLETAWRTAKHISTIEARPDISSDAKEYIIKWDSFVTPLRLSSNHFVPQALITFVKENIGWFYERKARVKEFSLHATSLRLRGIINVECFARCISMLRDSIEGHKRLEVKNREVDMHSADRDTITKDYIDENLADKAGAHAEGKEVETGDKIFAAERAWNEDTTVVGSLFQEVVDAEPAWEDSMDKTAVDEDDRTTSVQNQVLEYAVNKDKPGDVSFLTPGKDANEEPLDDDLIYEDASEEIEILDIDDYFDAEDGDSILHQPHYLQSYRQSLTQRWPMLKLHPREHFGIASVIAAIAIFQGFPNDNIDRLMALHIHYCPNENIQDLVHMYYNANDIVPLVPGVFMTEQRLRRIMWEAGREACEVWLTDVYRTEGGTRRTVGEAVEIAASLEMWDELWARIADECGG